MSRISAVERARRGFTLTELMIAMSLAAIIFTAIISAYLFLGRNLTRLVNTQRQEVESRRTIRQFTQDLSAASTLTTATSTSVALTKPTSGGPASVSYVYSAAEGTLTRSDAAGSQKLLNGVTAFAITYYNESGTAVTSTQSVKSVEISFSSGLGSSSAGTLARYTTVTPRIVLRNKPALQ